MILSEMDILRPEYTASCPFDHHDIPPIKWEEDFSLFMIVETTTHHTDSSSNSGEADQIETSTHFMLRIEMA